MEWTEVEIVEVETPEDGVDGATLSIVLDLQVEHPVELA